METIARSQPATEADAAPKDATLIYRQSRWTRLTHWLWAFSLFFMLLSGLQIFNARPQLYIGKESGFGYNNTILQIGAENTDNGPRGFTQIFGHRFDTTGVLGWSGPPGQETPRAFPAWATIPSYYDLGTARVVHFFFAWVLSATLLVWLIAGLVNGHVHRDLAPRLDDLRRLPKDIVDHAKLKFHHTREYNTLQKMAYGGVLFVLLPLMIITGLAMSPSMNSVLPWLNEILGGRQTARTIHFTVMVLLVLFFIIHMLMILAAGPINELRSIITGWYRTDPPEKHDEPAERSI
ncbi:MULTISPECIES: cytochrome b/b6 domain-containing protein [unclassified Mesorhizobium]|uniref:cytochrome b/b6 domain-containing protein n=1 Tax=unclassified Mesorhizobium TaxID=325217 RepID=UPI000F75B000|nr:MULTISPECIES: cytochrome b/b6 domain-containing protein [unclassified Mesorhizobium]AZO23341.1 cytochrome b/b6 domain-containing protein [Mesorhizobium sp. M1E.F.Ca.ET.045.02.1.1]RUW72778.1 cytochrome b/b6 domain-containing protein [Mesorhizobium sp. M1E.F.Ca.ET.063.01.1.1]RWB56266.1 MAG: cytochrome b/b6 domain-containing protein [Mesorhizobium sp.]RWD88345.1 MAG: cytochrome b/b6 domain-containing protein [Mesorhizobium sp.]TIV52277.1 MAG: cytochrome b/b6 domain-containing protein [Mesorhiz